MANSELMEAISKGPEQVANVLNNSAEIKDQDLHLALIKATANGYWDAVKVILEHNAEIKRTMNVDTLIIFQRTCEEGVLEVLKLLMEKGLKLDERDTSTGNTALHIAADGASEKIVERLLDDGLKLEETNIEGMTALHIAAKNNNEKILNLLLNCEANIEAKCKKGQTAVFYACAQGLKNNVKLLLLKGAEIDVADNEGATCFKFAVKSGNKSLVTLLLDCGAAISTQNYFRHNPLWIATEQCSEAMIQLLLNRNAVVHKFSGENSILHNACKQGFENIVKQLIERGANIQDRGEEGQTVLHAAVKSGKESMVRLILDLGIDVNARDNKELTPLHYATIEKHLNLMELLASRGADINAKDKSGVTALYFATYRAHEVAVKWLLERKATVQITSVDYDVHTHQLSYWTHKDLLFDYLSYPHTALHVAAEQGNKAITKLFLDHGIDVNIRGENNTTALHIASMEGQTEIVKLLLDYGADITLKTSSQNKSTAFHLACACNHVDIVTLLLGNGVNINDQDEMGYSALFIAIREQSQALVRILLNHGANSELQDNSNYTPLLYAVIKSKNEYKEELFKRKGKRYLEDYYYYANCDDYDEDGYILSTVEQLLNNGVNVDFPIDEFSTALNYAIDHRNTRLAKLLLNCAADINKVTLEGKILTAKSYHEDESMGDVITKHVVKMLSKREFVGEDALNFIRRTVSRRELQEMCQLEIDEMKKEAVGDSTILFYDILTSDNPSQIGFGRNEEMLKSFKLDNLQKLFPMYGSTLNYQMKKAVYRELLLSKLQGFFYAIANIEENKGLPKLPPACTSKIFNSLNNGDLRKLLHICNVKLDLEICDVSVNSFYY